jgi:hypothetical protein
MILNPIHLSGLLAALVTVVLIPGMIVVAGLIPSMANESAGWLRYKLPEVFFWIFLSTGRLASPFLRIGTLMLVWGLQRRAVVNVSDTRPKMRRVPILAGSECHHCPDCLDHRIQRGLLCSGRESLEDKLARCEKSF